MNHLTTLYVNQVDREREIAQGLRNRQILHGDETRTDVVRPAATTASTRPATTSPRSASMQVRAAGR